MSFPERRQRFRTVLAGDACVHPGSVFDPISARIAEDLGFEIGMFAGSIASYTVLGAPDLVVLTLTEFAEQIRRITRAGRLPHQRPHRCLPRAQCVHDVRPDETGAAGDENGHSPRSKFCQ